jgi:DNA-binding NtrC family response regulator
MPKFIVMQGEQPGSEIPFEGNRLVFGRTDDCDVVLPDPNVSRRHAHAVVLNGMVAMVDLGSSNGTLVNGIPISRTFLMDGDQVTLGGTLLQFIEDLEQSDEVGSVRPHAMRGAVSHNLAPKINREVGEDGQPEPLSHTKLFSPVDDDVKIDVLKDIYLKLKSLYRIFMEVAQAGSLKEMFEALGRGVTLSTGIERTVFFLNAEKSGGGWDRYFVHGSVRLSDEELDSAEFKPLLEQASTSRKAVLATLTEDGRCTIGAADANALVVPLIKAGKVAAIIYADCPASKAVLSREDVDFVTTLALQVTVRLNQFEQVQQLARENRELRRAADEDFAVVVHNEKMKQLMSVAERVASTDSTALITGESGTGKELIARTIHRFSTRGNKPLVAVNCAALPETLLESELFGHEKGAFTGAVEKRVGKFELADGGTLFLDEIGDISAGAQAKLLRVLQEGELQRVGGNKNIKVDVRLIAATNKNLLEEVQKGTFRNDLYYRLRVIELNIPTLRERPDDIPALAEFFFKQLRQRINTPVKRIGDSAMQALASYPWPGNVRELRNVIERGLVFAFGDELLVEHLPPEFNGGAISTFTPVPGSPAGMIGTGAGAGAGMAPPAHEPVPLAEMEKRHIQYVLSFVKGNKLKAAGLLGISRTTLYEKLKQYELAGDGEDERA